MTTPTHIPMTNDHGATAAPRNRRGRLSAVAGLALTLTASSCAGLPFGGDDASQDIAAVEVEGIEPSDNAQLSASRADDSSTTLAGSSGDQASDANDSSSTQPTSPDDTADSTATDDTSQAATPGAIETIDERFVGRSVEYLSTELALGAITVTNQDPRDLLKGIQGELDVPTVLIEVTATSRDGVAVNFPESLFGLVDSSGARFAPIDTLDQRGETMYSIGVESQATTRFVLVFPETDLAGASFVVSEAGLVPEIIPLTDTDTTQQSPYTFDLAAPTPLASVTAPGINDSCDLAMDVQIQSAAAVLEGNDSHRFERTAKGERFVGIDVSITNRNEPDIFSVCGAGFGPYQLEPRLEVDGVSLAPVNPIEFQTIELGATIDTRFVFRVDTGPSDLRLVSLNGDVIGEWSVDIPAVAGE